MSRYSNLSVYNDRIMQLSTKLSQIQSNVVTERSSRFESLHKKCTWLESRISENKETINQKLDNIKDQIDQVEKLNQQKTNSIDNLFKAKFSELTDKERSLVQNVKNYESSAEDRETWLLKQTQEKSQTLLEEATRTNKSSQDNISSVSAYLDQQIPAIKEKLTQESQQIQELKSSLLTKISEESTKSKDKLQEELKLKQNCTFTPQTTEPPEYQDVAIPGLTRFIEVKQIQAKLQADQKAREEKVFGIHYKGHKGYKTQPEPFNLHTPNTDRCQKTHSEVKSKEKQACTFRPETIESKNKAFISRLLSENFNQLKA